MQEETKAEERKRRRYLITGGAGFIGCNYADRLLGQGEQVTIYDNLSRKGSDKNLAWLHRRHKGIEVLIADVRNYTTLLTAVLNADVIVHLAAQTAVTTSVENPQLDFAVNAVGTFAVVETARQAEHKPIILYASTNKVYGELKGADAWAWDGIDESQSLDFHSPYGCSKGAGDQYVRDYARIYGLPTIVFRQSCIYGPRQMGVEDQGWLAWFIIAALTGQPITIYGDGRQVRDVLYIDDLLDAYDAAIGHIDIAAGQVYNIGGGPENKLSIWAGFGPMLEELLGRPIPVTYADWRPGDQFVYISDIRKAARDLDWQPRVGVPEGVKQLWDYIHKSMGREP